jgi:hypothetical protein
MLEGRLDALRTSHATQTEELETLRSKANTAASANSAPATRRTPRRAARATDGAAKPLRVMRKKSVKD